MRGIMLTDKMEYFSKQPKSFLTVLGILLCVILGVIDYITGYEISFSIFYLLPVSLVAWFVGRQPAIYISILSALIWLLADLSSGHTYSHYAIPLWNSIMRLGFFLTGAYFLTAIRKLLDHVTELSRRDPLTGVASRRHFYDLAESEINRLKRYGHPFTVCYIDIDNFKQINDTFGHDEGDNLLTQIAESIRSNMRRTDVVGRLGGDEFALLMPETGADAALNVVDKVLDLQDLSQKRGLAITLSIGMVVYLSPPENVDAMIKRADALMYSVKTGGKNNIKYEIVGRAGTDRSER